MMKTIGDGMSDSPWTLNAESPIVGGHDTVTLVDGSNFLLCGRNGDMRPGRVDGLFMLDTRVLSRWVLTVGGQPVEGLSVVPDGPFGAHFVGRVNLGDTIDAPLVVVQHRYVGRGRRDDIEIRNHGTERHAFEVRVWVDADFRNVFDVKAGHEGAVPDRTISTCDEGIDIVASGDAMSPVESVSIRAFPQPDLARGEGFVRWHVDIEPGAVWHACIESFVTAGGVEIEPSLRCGMDVAHAIPVARLRSWRDSTARIASGFALLDAAVNRSLDDLGALRIFDPEHVDRVVVAAGAPWFMTLFGRDSLLTSWMALPVDHALTRGVLAELADTQGVRVDPVTEEDPGRILHEVRFDRLSARLLGGSGRYYGSVDATPLFAMLVAELTRWTGASTETAALLPAVDRALRWMQREGDPDADGFVEYHRRHEHGLEHQGWKDSWDGIRHADGTVATPPIALCEVQAYRYAALRGRAELARAHGESDAVAQSFEQEAADLRARFDERFWLDDVGWYAVGLDCDKQPIGSLTSNIGHLLWSGIVPPDRAPRLAELLVGAGLFSGWGVRTLSAHAAGFNPLSYHCGSVWPHDTAIAIAGLARYGCDVEAELLSRALLDASSFSNGRLPELFGGFDRSDIGVPVPYPASCSPQAWAAASPLLIVRALLGLAPDAVNGRLELRPRVPDAFGRLSLLDLPIGDAIIDIRAEGNAASVDVKHGDLDVVIH
jgi:glycogen debranching enzyme